MKTLSPLDRPLAALHAHLQRAAARGERGVAWMRLVLALLVLVQLVVIDLAGEGVGTPGFWLVALACFVSGSWSVWTLWTLDAERLGTGRLMASVGIDALCITLAILGPVGWPFPGYEGVLRYPGMAVFCVVAGAAGVRLSRRVALLGAALCLVGEVGLVVADYALNRSFRFADLTDAAMLAVAFVGSSMLGYIAASRTKRLVFEGAEAALTAERARQRLGVYVSEEVAHAALSSPEIALGGRRQPVAVLFSDLRGFTRYSESLPPERLVEELNAYLDAMVTVIRAEGGVVDKFIGDAIMVVFGLPEARPDDAVRALRTARRMQQALDEHNRERRRQGRTPFAHGIGIHYGVVVAGHIGNAERLQFTVVGDVVNLASRLETATKELSASIVVSEELVAAARAEPAGEDLSGLESLGRLAIRGRDADLEVFTLAQPARGAAAR